MALPQTNTCGFFLESYNHVGILPIWPTNPPLTLTEYNTVPWTDGAAAQIIVYCIDFENQRGLAGQGNSIYTVTYSDSITHTFVYCYGRTEYIAGTPAAITWEGWAEVECSQVPPTDPMRILSWVDPNDSFFSYSYDALGKPVPSFKLVHGEMPIPIIDKDVETSVMTYHDGFDKYCLGVDRFYSHPTSAKFTGTSGFEYHMGSSVYYVPFGFDLIPAWFQLAASDTLTSQMSYSLAGATELEMISGWVPIANHSYDTGNTETSCWMAVFNSFRKVGVYDPYFEYGAFWCTELLTRSDGSKLKILNNDCWWNQPRFLSANQDDGVSEWSRDFGFQKRRSSYFAIPINWFSATSMETDWFTDLKASRINSGANWDGNGGIISIGPSPLYYKIMGGGFPSPFRVISDTGNVADVPTHLAYKSRMITRYPVISDASHPFGSNGTVLSTAWNNPSPYFKAFQTQPYRTPLTTTSLAWVPPIIPCEKVSDINGTEKSWYRLWVSDGFVSVDLDNPYQYNNIPAGVTLNKWIKQEINSAVIGDYDGDLRYFYTAGGTLSLVDDATVFHVSDDSTARFTTAVYVASETTIAFSNTTLDDGGAIYLNGVKIASSPQYTTSLSFNLVIPVGWSTIDIVDRNNGGNGNFNTNGVLIQSHVITLRASESKDFARTLVGTLPVISTGWLYFEYDRNYHISDDISLYSGDFGRCYNMPVFEANEINGSVTKLPSGFWRPDGTTLDAYSLSYFPFDTQFGGTLQADWPAYLVTTIPNTQDIYSIRGFPLPVVENGHTAKDAYSAQTYLVGVGRKNPIEGNTIMTIMFANTANQVAYQTG